MIYCTSAHTHTHSHSRQLGLSGSGVLPIARKSERWCAFLRQAFAAWQWSNFWRCKLPAGRRLLRINLDETAVCLFQGGGRGNVFLATADGAVNMWMALSVECGGEHVRGGRMGVVRAIAWVPFRCFFLRHTHVFVCNVCPVCNVCMYVCIYFYIFIYIFAHMRANSSSAVGLCTCLLVRMPFGLVAAP